MIPSGAPDHPLGGLGYVRCAQEILQQSQENGLQFSAIVHATSSGSTQAGLLVGLAACGVTCQVIGIEVDAAPDVVRSTVLKVARNTVALIGVEGSISDDAVHIETGYAGPAYGIPSLETVQAIQLVGRLEGILLDPVYEGKAMAGLIAMVRQRLFAPADLWCVVLWLRRS